VFEPVANVLLQPRPSYDASILDPQPDLPFRLASLVLTQTPSDVAYVPGRARSEQASLFDGQLLHPRDDFRSEPHTARLCADAPLVRPETADG
jgi:hypothetical protein